MPIAGRSASPPPGSPQAAGNLNATPQTTSITRGGSAVTSPQLKIVSQTSSTVTVALDASPPLQADWTINGTDKGTSETVEFDCAPGATVQVNAVVADTPGANGSFTTYYRFDHPSKRTESDPISYAVDPDHTRDEPAPDQTPTSKWPGNQVQDELFARLADVPAATPITILGYASFESYDNPTVGGTDWIHMVSPIRIPPTRCVRRPPYMSLHVSERCAGIRQPTGCAGSCQPKSKARRSGVPAQRGATPKRPPTPGRLPSVRPQSRSARSRSPPRRPRPRDRER